MKGKIVYSISTGAVRTILFATNLDCIGTDLQEGEAYGLAEVSTDAERNPTLYVYVKDTLIKDLSKTKSVKIAKIKQEANDRILAQWPYYAQLNALSGLYDSLPSSDPFNPNTMKEGIKTVIDAEHAAEAAITQLTTTEDVDNFTW